ncbi:MAG: hypothetical protein AAF830_14075 [Pseudomonadota bacterium]
MSRPIAAVEDGDQRADFVLSWQFFVGVLCLTAGLLELHEQAHIWSGYIACGAFGDRLLNTWTLADGCTAIWPVFAGPAFTLSAAGAGLLLMAFGSARLKALGIALFWAAGPASRAYGVIVFGGGDEVVGTIKLLDLSGVDAWARARIISGSALAIIGFVFLTAYAALTSRRPIWAWTLVSAVFNIAALTALIVLVISPLEQLMPGPGFGPFGSHWVALAWPLTAIALSVVALPLLLRAPARENSRKDEAHTRAS